MTQEGGHLDCQHTTPILKMLTKSPCEVKQDPASLSFYVHIQRGRPFIRKHPAVQLAQPQFQPNSDSKSGTNSGLK